MGKDNVNFWGKYVVISSEHLQNCQLNKPFDRLALIIRHYHNTYFTCHTVWRQVHGGQHISEGQQRCEVMTKLANYWLSMMIWRGQPCNMQMRVHINKESFWLVGCWDLFWSWWWILVLSLPTKLCTVCLAMYGHKFLHTISNMTCYHGYTFCVICDNLQGLMINMTKSVFG